ncbi:hypothetical protein E8E11_007845 [Didymella keratinophila]|nr:hypothetical protein E8E11_007845 [Didymella keratinophila]
MSYEDLLKRFDLLDRTKLFDHNWTVVQQWTSVAVGWVTGFMNTKFSVEIKKKGPTVFQLCQLDGRYFRGLEGKYDFDLHFILQEKDTEEGDYIVRARGAWFGNRSISAEVDLEPGLYEIVPKLVARRDADSPDVHEVVTKVVTKVAERNPQKLRQIGLAYDVVNAKGVMELSEEEKKRKETKQKAAADKKKKEKEAAEKYKTDFEAWKKDEKAEYEAWKKEKQRLEKQTKSEMNEPGTTDSKADSPDTKDAFSVAEDEVSKPAEAAANSSVAEASTDVTSGAQEPQPASASFEADLVSKTAELKVDDAAAPSDDDKAEHTPDKGPDNRSRASSRAISYYGDESPQEAGPRARSPIDDKPKPWNAVCVLGLRVYSQDSEVSIKLVKPKNVEEGAILDVGGEIAAGATIYDGFEKAAPNLLSNPGVRQPRQDSGVDFETMAGPIHNEAVGTLFASQAAADIVSTAEPPISPPAVNAGAQTHIGPEASIFARYETHVRHTRAGANQIMDELRGWLERFKLPQAAPTTDPVDVAIDIEASPHPPRKRSLSFQTTDSIATQVPRLRSADGSVDSDFSSTPYELGNDNTEGFAVNERLNLLLSDALPMLPQEMTCEWDERQRAREEYESIEWARVIRLDSEERLAQAQAANLEVAVNEWADAEEDRNRTERFWSQYKPPSNWPEYVSPGGLESWLEGSVIKELQHTEELTDDVFGNIHYKDSRTYIIPRIWDMTDRPRRTRLYSNTYYFKKYMWRERRVFSLIEGRLEDLREGQSEQSEADIAEEIKYLEYVRHLRTNAERDYYDLMRDFLKWAIAHTTLEFQGMTNGGPKPTRRNALTHDIPHDLVEDMIEDSEETGMMDRYERLRLLEQAYFPERFIASPLPPKPPPTQTQPQYTPGGRQIPKRKVLDGIEIGNDDADPLHFGERLMRTLPQSFKPQNAQFFRVKYTATSVPTLDRKMLGEPTSPLKPPEMDHLRPPKAKLKIPLRMKFLSGEIQKNAPEPMSPSMHTESATTHPRYNSRTGTYICVIQNYWQVLRQLSFRASSDWVEPTHVGQGRQRNIVSRGSLRIELPDASKTEPQENFGDMLAADDFKPPEGQRFFDEIGTRDSRVRTEDTQDPAEPMQDPEVRVIDFAMRASSKRTQGVSTDLDPAHLIEHIEDIDDLHADRRSPLASKKPVWRASKSTRDIDKVPEVTVAEIANSDSGTGVIEVVPEDEDEEVGLLHRPFSRLEHRVEDRSEVDPTEDEAGLFQRPISRPEHHVEDRPEVNVTEIDITEVEGSDSATDTFHDAPE